jgi:hypothetical protein
VTSCCCCAGQYARALPAVPAPQIRILSSVITLKYLGRFEVAGIRRKYDEV